MVIEDPEAGIEGVHGCRYILFAVFRKKLASKTCASDFREEKCLPGPRLSRQIHLLTKYVEKLEAGQ
jgi:hypothetical protein